MSDSRSRRRSHVGTRHALPTTARGLQLAVFTCPKRQRVCREAQVALARQHVLIDADCGVAMSVTSKHIDCDMRSRQSCVTLPGKRRRIGLLRSRQRTKLSRS